MKTIKKLISPFAGPEEFKRAKNEILLYGGIYDYTAEYLVRDINTYPDEEDIAIRMHTQGGKVMGCNALLSRLSDREGSTRIKVDGFAYSMGAFMCLYVKKENVSASEEARFMFHKAAYPSYYEPDEAEKQELKETNAKYKRKMKERLNDSSLSAEIINKVFESDIRNDVYVSAKDAKKIGLVGEVKPLTPDVKAYLEQQAEIFADFKNNGELANEKQVNNNSNNSNFKSMTKAELKEKHPELYASIYGEGITAGVTTERDRVGSFLPYLDAAPEAVKKGIKEGKAITETQRSEFAIAMHKQTMLEAEKENKGDGKTIATDSPEGAEAEAEKQQQEIEASIEKQGLTLKA